MALMMVMRMLWLGNENRRGRVVIETHDEEDV